MCNVSHPLAAEQGQLVLPSFGIPFAPQGHHFSVPSLPDDTPWQYSIATSLDTVATFASVLLQRDIIRGGDWTGDLQESVTNGLERWANTVLGGYSLEYLNIIIIYTDDVGQLYFEHEEWLEEAQNSDHIDKGCDKYGAFALETISCDMCEVGGKIEVLNSLYPNAGYACLQVVQDALSEFFAFTPRMAHSLLSDYHEQKEEDGDYRETDTIPDADEGDSAYPSRDKAEKELPKELYDRSCNISAVTECMQLVKDPRDIRLLQDVLDLHFLVEASQEAALLLNGFAAFGHSDYCWESHVPCVGIFNKMEGIEESIFDDFRNSITQGEHTYVCFMHTFDVANPKSIARGASALNWVLKLLILADSVLQGMNWNEARDHRFDTTVRTHLDKHEELKLRQQNNQERPY